MTYIRHIYAVIFIVLIVLIIRLIFRKYELHFRILKELYPNKFKQINSFYNPLLGFYLFKLNAAEYFWFSSPLFFRKKFLLKDSMINIKNYINNLRSNNKKIYLSILLLLIWIGIGFLLSVYHSNA